MSTPEAMPGPAGAPAAGVIHDIGYRHYTGERLGRQSVTFSLFIDSLRGAFGLGRSAKSKVMPILLLAVISAPAAIVAIVTNVTQQDELPFDLTSYAWFVYIPLALYVASQAPASVSRDLRFRVTSLYFSRPLRREDYVRAKYAAMTCAVTAVLLTPLLILLAGMLLADFDLWDSFLSFGQAATGVVVVSLVMAGIGLSVASVTPRRGLGVAAVIAVFLLSVGIQNVLQDIAVVQGRNDLATWTTLISPISVVDTLQAWVFGVEPTSGLVPEGAQGLVWLAVTVALIGACYGFLVVRYRKVSVS